jgi:predicted transcriptional regulator
MALKLRGPSTNRVASYVAMNEWQVDLIKQRLVEAKRDGTVVPHEDVKRRLKRRKAKPVTLARKVANKA